MKKVCSGQRPPAARRLSRWSLVLALVGVAGLSRAAVAGPSAEVVALLPPRTTDAKLRIYERPVAKAVAKHLGELAAFSVAVVLPTGDVPPGAALVIDGRIVGGADASIVLEATVRDPGRGETVAAATTAPRALGEIDGAARALATELAPRIREALRVRRARSDEEAASTRVGEVRAPQGPGRATPTPASDGTARAMEHPAAGPAMIVFRAGGSVGDAAVAVDEVATVALVRLATQLGFRPLPLSDTGIVGVERVRELAATHRARYALMIQLLRVRFEWHGVLAARGAARVILVDADGRERYDRVLETDTVVGSRGDRHVALVRFVATQLADIAFPELRRRLARSGGR